MVLRFTHGFQASGPIQAHVTQQFLDDDQHR